MTVSDNTSQLEQRLIDHIGLHGPITFESFMDTVLYDKNYGYYPNRRRQRGSSPVGTDGDYFTSPSSHPAFGALLALQLDEMWRTMGSPGEFTVVEMGAGDGVLGSDISEYVERELPEFAQSISYVSTDLFPPTGTNDVAQVSALPVGVTGCVISNELLDAHPVNRFIVQSGEVREIFVGYRDGQFEEVIGEVSEPEIAARVKPFLGSLPESYRGEVNLRLGYWSDSVSATLKHGYVVTIDYGYDRPELYKPERMHGSLRCYYQHTLGQNPLIRMGRQDITAHVDFTAVDHTLLVNGFRRIGKLPQLNFLVNLGIDNFLNDISRQTSGVRGPGSESREDLVGIGSLIAPDGLGRFTVAVHARGAEDGREASPTLTGVVGGQPLTQGHSVPTLNSSSAVHARLLRSSMPFLQNRPQSNDLPTWEELFSDDP